MQSVTAQSGHAPHLIHTVHSALRARRYHLNGRLAARRFAGGILVGLILSFPLLVTMLILRLSPAAIIGALILLNLSVGVWNILRGPWAGMIDSAVYLEDQLRKPGLFITAVDYLDSNRALLSDAASRWILSQAASACEGGLLSARNSVKLAPVFSRLWAVNGLLLLGLLITAVLGKAMLSSAPEATNPTIQSVPQAIQWHTSERNGHAPFSGNAKTNMSSIVPQPGRVTSSRSGQTMPARRTEQAVGTHDQLMRRAAAQKMEKLRQEVSGLLNTTVGSSAKSNGNGAGGNNLTSGSTQGRKLAALKAEIMATVHLPGIGTRTGTMLIAAAKAIHASSRGNFAPELQKLNEQLEAYLKTHAGWLKSSVPGTSTESSASEAHGGSVGQRGSGNAALPQTLQRTGNAERAMVMDIPDMQGTATGPAQPWATGKPIPTMKIPPRYREVIQRYFSAGK